MDWKLPEDKDVKDYTLAELLLLGLYGFIGAACAFAYFWIWTLFA